LKTNIFNEKHSIMLENEKNKTVVAILMIATMRVLSLELFKIVF
jgi:hypothetical protein